MAKAKRVFEIAKELGVTSKAIVEKCKAEGVPDITNHMSVVKIGLAMTIQEWFTVGDSETAIETAEKVDLTKVRAPRRHRAKAGDSDDATATMEIGDDAASTEAAATDQVGADEAAADDAPPAVEAAPVAEAPVVEAPQAVEPVAPVHTPEVAAKAAPAPEPKAESRQVGQLNVPERPKVIKPMGHKLEKPKGAVLKGPNVVRIEAPEQIQAPRSRRPSGPGGPGQGGGGGTSSDGTPGITRSRGPARGRGAGGPAPVTDEPGAKPRRRSLSTRRGRSAEAIPIGPGKISEQDLIELDARLKGAPGYLKQRRRTMKKSGGGTIQAMTPAQVGGKVEVSEPITIKSLSSATGIKTADIIKYLFKKSIMATINSAIDVEAAMEVALEYDIELDVRQRKTAEQQVIQEFETQDAVDIRRRPPVVAVLGHVDHGKTSLLDRIRQADVAAHEDGGITQHVGAYRVTVKAADGSEKRVVFLDTPGHEAFTSMRARGAHITDLIVLVVAADDGVMPQTIESINHAKAAGVPIIVALNKIDKPEATEGNIRKIYGQLAEHGLNPVEWGGETEIVKTSAITGTGIADIMEVLDYQAELKELSADYGIAARGVVIETQMQEGRGPVARVLVQHGTLHLGDFIVIGRAFGRVRDMTDDRRVSVKDATPSTPLELSGIDLVPDAGDKFYVTSSLQKAEEIATQFRERERQLQLASQTKVTLDNFAATIKAGQTVDLRIVLKADVQGSIDVLKKSLAELGNDEVTVRVLHAAVGGITESDVLLADASDAVVIGFHVVAPAAVRDIAEQRGVDIRLYRIIYDLTDNVRKALEGMLSPETKEEELGTAEVREVFRITKIGNIAGCLVTAGVIQRGAKVRVVRDGAIVTDERTVDTLRRVKDDAKEVRVGTECGIRITNFEDVKPGDKFVCYKSVTVARKL